MSRLFMKREFLSGLLMAATGGGFLLLSLGYPMGSARNIGAGVFPALIAGLLVLVGLVVAIRAAFEDGPVMVRSSLLPVILVTGGIIAFAVLLPSAGFVVATATLILLCALTHPQFTWPGALGLAAVVIVFGAGVFIYGLGLPIALIGPLLRF